MAGAAIEMASALNTDLRADILRVRGVSGATGGSSRPLSLIASSPLDLPRPHQPVPQTDARFSCRGPSGTSGAAALVATEAPVLMTVCSRGPVNDKAGAAKASKMRGSVRGRADMLGAIKLKFTQRGFKMPAYTSLQNMLPFYDVLSTMVGLYILREDLPQIGLCLGRLIEVSIVVE